MATSKATVARPAFDHYADYEKGPATQARRVGTVRTKMVIFEEDDLYADGDMTIGQLVDRQLAQYKQMPDTVPEGFKLPEIMSVTVTLDTGE